MADHAAVAADSSAAVDDADANLRLLSVSWNQDSSCFTAATTAGFRVYSCAPFREELELRRRRALLSGGAGGYAMAEMLFRSNIFALVPAGEDGEHRVEIWDDLKKRRAHTYDHVASIRSAVRAVRVSREFVAVVLDRAVRVYCLHPLTRLVMKAETALNSRGLCCLSCHAGDASVLACPGTAPGQVRVENLKKVAKVMEKEQAETRLVIAAHSSELACMAMTVDGAVLATASVKGTLVRVFSTVDGACLQEVRRGRDPAEIHSIALSPDLQWMAVCSDKGTLHVFSLRFAGGNKQYAAARPVVQANPASNARSALSFMKVILPDYFSSEWSFAQFRLPETTRHIAAFGEKNTVMIIGMDGSFYRCSFDPVKGKEMVRMEYFRFLKDKQGLTSN